jgi:hypothetical protein
LLPREKCIQGTEVTTRDWKELAKGNEERMGQVFIHPHRETVSFKKNEAAV